MLEPGLDSLRMLVFDLRALAVAAAPVKDVFPRMIPSGRPKTARPWTGLPSKVAYLQPDQVASISAARSPGRRMASAAGV